MGKMGNDVAGWTGNHWYEVAKKEQVNPYDNVFKNLVIPKMSQGQNDKRKFIKYISFLAI